MDIDKIKNLDPQAELRFVSNLEAVNDEAGVRTIEGIAAMVNKSTIIHDSLGDYEEVIRPGSFDSTINNDIRIVKNHSQDLLLGRSKNGKGTGRVYINDEGHLAFTVPVRDSRSHSVDTYDEILSGDIDGCSFLFRVSEERITYPDDTNGRSMPLREILDFEVIYDVGPVTYPYYESTSVIARSITAPSPKVTPIKNKLRRKFVKVKFGNING